MIRQLLARLFWALGPWRLVAPRAVQTPTVIIGAPHTSNWDFVLMLAIAWRLRIRLRWLGKHTLFTSWKGPLMRALGGIPVDRSSPGTVVAEVVARVRAEEAFALVITPDGTRSNRGHWKSGFHRIARETGLPVTLGFVDRTTMTTGLGPSLEMTGDVRADMDRIRAFYADKAGYCPARRSEPRLREEGEGTPEACP
ncbi:1-acyl-sn-glycerol-3-phosphate acyltransferase [Brachybacterium saurashtrense]|uniref:Acyl-phosphate glycerol 3-phosphate acyltransferase n=1 Tax=Brachybacterium saurashtrense TaxID=556288 RepID=A0A345YP32_9MICO|nr:1-acyl-sn-glycerol-3-phosphate acyltransferase [Brachybacterium saurashtrense]AXK45684.1 acyl-phosphate glycerol 3-phosphate acyltransferase [Brachybacterium saurashtrense]RRR24701.1 acyl-phosphate glycerol 3-phosphate acyltransferase [Brachybacterium saurashtrense]